MHELTLVRCRHVGIVETAILIGAITYGRFVAAA